MQALGQSIRTRLVPATGMAIRPAQKVASGSAGAPIDNQRDWRRVPSRGL